MDGESTELPSVAALIAEDEGGHGLVGGPSLELVVGAVLFATLATLQHVSLSALDFSKLGVVDTLLDEGLSLLLDLVVSQLFARHLSKFFSRKNSSQEICSQPDVFLIL